MDGRAAPPPVTPETRRAAQARAESYNRQRQLWSLLFSLLLIPVVLAIIWLDVGELNTDVLLSLAGFIVVTAVLAYFTLRSAAASWQGVLVDQYFKGSSLYLIFRTDRGKRVKLIVGSRLAGYFTLGDTVVKIKGFDYPEKLHRDGDRQLCVACGGSSPSERRSAPPAGIRPSIRVTTRPAKTRVSHAMVKQSADFAEYTDTPRGENHVTQYFLTSPEYLDRYPRCIDCAGMHDLEQCPHSSP